MHPVWEDAEVAAIAKGNLVRWRNGQTGNIGVVADVSNDRQVSVSFDGGDLMTFAWPSSVLERVLFPVGSQVETTGEREVGVVVGVSAAADILVYQVNLSGGATKLIVESGLRPAIVTDPIALLRAGELGSARSCNLRIAATRLVFGHQYDELASLSNSRVEIKEHQVAVVHRVATTYPHRFILADEVGLGKTIEAGLILKELKARGVANRVLILAPSGIVSQWQYELRTKFNEPFAFYNKPTIAFLENENPGDNVWTLRDNVIASTTYAAWDEKRRNAIAMAGWDLVIIDEAHHARRTHEGEGRYRSRNLYRLAEALADPDLGRSLGYLLLTATPMQLDPFELYSLIELLDPTLFADERDFDEHRSELAGLNATVDALDRWEKLDADEREEAREALARFLDGGADGLDKPLASIDGRAGLHDELAAKHRLSEVLIRNRKAKVGGFMPRVATVWPVDMTDQEWEAYEAVTEYVRTGYAQSRATRNNAVGFLMAVLQKLNTSSSFAIRQSLQRRIAKLEAGLAVPVGPFEIEEDELEEGPVGDALGDLLAVPARASIEQEIIELSRIVQLLGRIEIDTKTIVLRGRLVEIAREEPDAKVLIFTQSRDTQIYLARHLGDPWTVNLFHGQLDAREKDAAVTAYRQGSGPQVLISTEAGGEGRNFQFCHLLINYDLPWNPMKVEQRIGRLDRIGQKHPVEIFNFSVNGTIEERVLDVLANRIRVFEETIGGLDPILGTVESDLQKVFLMAEAEGAKALERLDVALESRIRGAREAERRLADLIMDTKSYRKDEVDRLLGHRGPVNTEALKRFTLGALHELGVSIDEDPQVPGGLELRLRGQFENEFPQFAREGAVRRVTFEPSVAREHEELEFLAIGHEIVDALLARVRSKEYGARTSCRVIRVNERPPSTGWFFTFVLEFQGVTGSKEVFPVFVSADGAIDAELAEWLLDRSMLIKREDWDAGLPERGAAFDRAVQLANEVAVQRLMDRQVELQATNRERAGQERDKLERFYAYRRTAADEKVAAVRRTLERLEQSSDPEVQRILPVWRKNLENAERALATVAADRERRLAQLSGRETVTAQNEALTASYVRIVPDMTA